MSVAGCGTHTAQLLDRNGATVAAANVLTEVEWNRVLDGTSAARALIQPDGDCCGRLGNVGSWRNRLVLFRDGQYVWDGPVTSVTWSLGEVEILAEDISVWLGDRVPHESKSFTNVDLSEIAQWLIDDAFAPDDPGHKVKVIGKAGISGSRSYTAGVGQSGDHLDQLAEAGIDYTVIGSTVLLLPETHLVSVGRLSDADLPDGLEVSDDGKALVTRWIVEGSDDSGVIGSDGGVDPVYGLHERYVQMTEITDTASAVEAAKARRRTSAQVPVFIDTQQVTISPLAAIDVPNLVPGWALDITSSSTCRKVTQRLKITGVKVTETGGDETTPGTESVQVQVAAAATEVA
ncbi:hypothetical protein DI272_18575 [Streptomyces sp. Act143]|uniref:hypothetical protein n=1 Tax=Streptomyces sp. Act143 TaxID=2200760 RepID=UPI000D676ADB|nr:hypothetical protein [Streptomyces sp. Act143]PWI15943.1 hypothetical protein DI272_18575 [Streptomyces sp. Act143]